MRPYGLFVVLAACASAEPPGEAIDASEGKRDAAFEPMPDGAVDAAMNACPSTDTCTGAMMLGTVSGDTPTPKLTASGYRSAWFRVRVTEDNSGEIGLALRVASKITMPPGVQFDTFVYVNAGSDQIECSTTTGTKTNTGSVTQVKAEWGEGFIPNGVSDSRNVSIEVRPLGTNCSPGAMWQLEIEGNWLN